MRFAVTYSSDYARWLVGGLLLLVGSGCRMFEADFDSPGESPLRAAQASADAVTLELFWARFPAGSAALNDEMWREIQEDRLSPELRARLAQHGLRAGVVAGTPPAAIMALLNPEGRTFDELLPEDQVDSAILSETPKVIRRLKQLRLGTRMEVQASEVIESAALLVPADGEVGGGTYGLAQAIYQVEVNSVADQRFELQVTPELQYGPQRMQWSQDDMGVFRQAPLRDAEVFRDLRMNVPLSPGEMLVVLGLPKAAGRLGHYFHTVETPTGREQKAVLIRLTEAPRDATFGGNGWW